MQCKNWRKKIESIQKNQIIIIFFKQFLKKLFKNIVKKILLCYSLNNEFIQLFYGVKNMEILSKLCYQARIKGLDIDENDGVKIMNSINKKYIHILPTGKICSDDILGHDKALKGLMTDFLITDPMLYSGSFLALPCDVSLHVGKKASQQDITFAKCCLMQSFAYIKTFKVVKDENLLSHECRIEHGFTLTYKERQAFINACLEYLN